MPGRSRLANDAWEALLTAHAEMMRQFAAEDVWNEVSRTEYDVLYTLSKCRGPIRLGELNRRAPDARAEVPTHASLVAEKYGDGPTRKPTPNANQGNNLAGPSPYEDSAELAEAEEVAG